MVGSELVLHVGFPQTAAAVLQQALRRLRPQLHRHGIGVVDHGAVAELDSRAGWQRELVAEPGAIRAFERDLGGLVEREAAEAVRQSDAGLRATIVSSDHLVGRHPVDGDDEHRFRRLAVPAVAQAIRATGASRVLLVGYLRRQDRVMERSYLQAVQQGATHTFAQQFPHRFEPVLDYLELLERLGRLPEVQQVHVRPVELVGSSASRYAADFLSVLGLCGQLDLSAVGDDLTPERLYSPRALSIALDVNPFLESELERRRVRDFLLEHFPATGDDDSCFLADGERARILDAYAPVNRQLFERYLPDLPPDAYASSVATAELAGAGPGSPPAAGAPPPTRSPLGGPAAAGPPAGRRPARFARDGRAALALRTTVMAAGRTSLPGHRACLSAVRRRYRLTQASVVLTAFPACGLGWLRMMLGLALARHAGLSPHDPLGVTEGGAVGAGLPRILAVPPGRLASARRRPPLGLGGRKVVVMARDPRQVLASRSRCDGRRQPQAESRAERRARERGNLESLLALYDAWAEERRRRPADVMVVRYEDLHAEAAAVLRLVLEFAGVGSAEPRWLRHAVEESSFDQLAAALHSRPGDGLEPQSDEEARRVDERIGQSVGAAAFGYGPGPARDPWPVRSLA